VIHLRSAHTRFVTLLLVWLQGEYNQIYSTESVDG
jgi:hypothetical protein